MKLIKLLTPILEKSTIEQLKQAVYLAKANDYYSNINFVKLIDHIEKMIIERQKQVE